MILDEVQLYRVETDSILGRSSVGSEESNMGIDVLVLAILFSCHDGDLEILLDGVGEDGLKGSSHLWLEGSIH